MSERKPDNLSLTNSKKPQLDDELLTAEQVADVLKLTVEAVYSGEGAAAELTPLRFGKRCTRWSRNELQQMIAQKLTASQTDDSPAETTNVYRLERAPKRATLSRDEIKSIVKRYKNE